MYFYSLYNPQYWLRFGSPIPEIVSLFEQRVASDGGEFEAESCLANQLDAINGIDLLDTASLLLTPNAYKEGKLYSIIPENGDGDFTFTRATTATRVNSAGLVELVPYNYFSYSEQFDNAAWSKNRVTISANATAAPNGTTTADKIIINSGSQENPVVFVISGSETSIRTLSFYAKASEYNIAFGRVGGGANNPIVLFSLTGNGSILHNQFVSSYAIESLGNGWYRCSMTYEHKPSFAPNVGVCSSTYSVSATSVTSTGNGTSGIFIWGAQANDGALLPYQKTETRLNIPRLDYSLGGCPSILLEPQRTNLALQSSSFDNATWIKINTTTATANNTISPSGVQDADRLTEGVAFSQYGVTQGISVTSGNSYTISTYFKPNGRNSIVLRMGTDALWSGGIHPIALFNADTMTATIIQGIPTLSIKEVGNGWYRCTMTAACVSSGASSATIYLNQYSGYTGNGTSGIYLWGAQLEAGAYATSYIPTTSASVTRNLDDSSVTSFSSGIGQTEGVLFTEVAFGSTDNRSKWIAFLWLSGTSFMGIYTSANGRYIAEVVNGGTIEFQFTSSVFALPNEKHKIALAYKANDFAFYIDGVQIALDNSGTVPACNQVKFNYNTTTNNLTQKYYSSLILWKERLTNDQLAQLTTI